MSWTSRFANLFRRERLDQELLEEMNAHLEEALEQGRAAEEARRAFGNALLHRERSSDVRLLRWLDALASDVVFGLRQIRKHRAASAAAILSLGLAVGATTAAFRLVNAVLLRTLPVAEPERLFYLSTTFTDRDGHPDTHDEFDYPTYRKYREIVADRADLVVAGRVNDRRDVTYGSTEEIEKMYRQYVSGNFFGTLGLQPSLGRLIAPNDDLTPGGQPVAVLSYAYWTRRFARDPHVLGKTFRLGSYRFEIIGVGPKNFTGTEPGALTDVFLPAMMNASAIDAPGWVWFRIWVRPNVGVSPEQIRQPLQAAFLRAHQNGLKNFPPGTPKTILDAYLNEQILILPAASGASRIQKEYRRPLLILALLVGLVLLIACANVGNLLTAQAAARAREMALRVSIGAGQWRLIQLVLTESALLAVAASLLGMLFASWSAPIVVSMLHVPGDPVRLVLDAGWQGLAFSIALTLSVTLLFGLVPALRASTVKPMSVLKGGDDPHSRRRLMSALLCAQTAFCVLVLFVGGLFVATFERLVNRPLGFAPQNIVILDANSRGKNQPVSEWLQVVDQLRQTPGVESASLAGWALLTGNRWTRAVRVPGQAIEQRFPYFLSVAPGFFETMRIGTLGGRDFRAADAAPRQNVAGVGIVNEAFARTYFHGQNPVGQMADVYLGKNAATPMQIVGCVRDAAYGSVREPIRPTVYVPMGSVNNEEGSLAFIVRTAADPRALASTLRRQISGAAPGFLVRTVTMESELVSWHLIRERLLATLSLFFSGIALVLAAVGLYGVLNYSVTQQRREIGIRLALGARSVHVVRQVLASLAVMLGIGAAAGLAAGVASGRFLEALLFDVRATDLSVLASPLLMLAAAGLVAALPAAIRAVRIDPARTLRDE